jgi:uncharacterized protein with HEPN domain
MTRHDPKVSFLQMRDTVREVASLTQNKSHDDLAKDRVLNLALTRLLEVLGEAATRIPEEIRNKYPELPWKQVISLRNRLIHAYDQVDLEILWEIVSEDLPPLSKQLNQIIENWGAK